MGPTILLFSQQPAFFERRDTWFNRRGVDVFCAMDIDEVATIFSVRRVDLMLSQGVPGELSEGALRKVVPAQVPIILLTEGGDDARALASYTKSETCNVLKAPFGDKVMHLTARALAVPTRHYLRILVQIQVGESAGGTFGFSNNISTTGMLLETKRKLAVGETVGLSFMLPGAPQMTATHALVVREAPAEGNTFRFGVKFIDLPANDQEFLANLRTQDNNRAAASA